MTTPQPEVILLTTRKPEVILLTTPQFEFILLTTPQPEFILLTTPQPEVILHVVTAPQPELILLKIHKLSIIKQFTPNYHLLFLAKHIPCRRIRYSAKLIKVIHMEGRRYPPCGETGLRSCVCVQLVLLW